MVISPQALALIQQGEYDRAVDAVERALSGKQAREQLQPRFTLGAALMMQKAWPQAANVFGALHKIVPDHADTLKNLGASQIQAGLLLDAAETYVKLLALDPAALPVRLMAARLLISLHRYKEACILLDVDLPDTPHGAEAHAMKGQCLQSLYDFEGARAALARAAAILPEEPRHFFNLCMLMDLTRDKGLPEQVRDMPQGIAETPEGLYWQGVMAERQGLRDEALALLEQAALKAGPITAPFIHFARGRLLDRADRPEEAIVAFTQGNKAQFEAEQAASLQQAGLYRMLDAVKAFAAKGPRLALRQEADNQRIVFISGFPRSGTTLLGQMLSMHPEIYVADEAPAINTMLSWFEETGKLYPQSLPELSQDDLNALAARFMAAHKDSPLWEVRPILIDKMPLNCIHLALLKAVFPHALHIFMLRDPVDCVLSAFMQHFRLNQALTHTLDLKDCARLYQHVMATADAQFPQVKDALHTQKYEDLVTDSGGQLRGITRFIGVGWYDGMLRFHENESPRTLTPSHAQISKPLYPDAKQRWLKYRHVLDDVPDMLSAWSERFGYAGQ